MLYLFKLQFDNFNSTTMPNKLDISDDEKELFRESMRDVIPLNKKSKHNIFSEKLKVKPIRPNPTSRPTQPTYFLSNYYQNSVQVDTTLSFTRGGISKKRLLEIKNSVNRYEAKLDLHGFQSEQAAHELTAFIERQYSLNKKLLLIIHGKGGKNGEDPILKNLVNHWLPQIPQVLIFHSALPKDGGTGALYVLLKTRSR